uniref:Spindle and kinetochore-associated protein 3 n=1 Tax=Cyclopterus lumpus TaxID=8103 RepID=A0A8C2ZR40_CYCLU
MAVTLESETVKLQHAFENRDDDVDDDASAKASRAYHEVNCEVGVLKEQIQGQIAQQKREENEAAGFIEACRVLEQRVAKDIQGLRGHWGKYGYQAKDEPSEVKGEAAGEPKSSPGGEGENLEEDGGHRSSPPPFPDTLRTPRLSDFGLSEVAMKRAGGGWCSEVSPMPPFLSTPTPLTPKCALRMDDDEPQTHLMADFGLSERTAFLNNDFTMDLFRKNEHLVDGNELNQISRYLARKDILMFYISLFFWPPAQNLESPEPPVFYTPGFKIKKPNRDRSPPAQSDGDPEFPDRHGNLPATPEAPVFQTPSMNRMATSGKVRTFNVCLFISSSRLNEQSFLHVCSQNAPQPEPIDMDAEAHLHSPRSKRRWEEEVPDMSDLSSVTQDICKVSPEILHRTPHLIYTFSWLDLSNYSPRVSSRAVRLSEVSESEFQSLPKYLKQMTLLSLNRAVMNINMFTGESRGGQTEFRMEDLSRICVTGTKTPLYVLCLVELKRLQQTGGARGSSVYTLCN